MNNRQNQSGIAAFFAKHENISLIPAIFALAWPTMLEQLLQTTVQYIDTAMVGRLGTQAMAATGVTSTVNWLIGGTLSALGIGFLALISRALGAGQKEKARRIAAQSVFTVLLFGIASTILCVGLSNQVPVWMNADPEILPTARIYFLIICTPLLFRTSSMVFGTVLRAAGDSKTPMRVGLLANVINIIGNFLLIYPQIPVGLGAFSFVIPGFGLGVAGAALSSAIAYTIGGIIIAIRLYAHPTISFKGQSIAPNWKILKRAYTIAFPNMLQRFGTSMGYVVFASMINTLGPVSIAAHTVANTVESAFYIPGWGMQAAAATLAGNCLGAKDFKKLYLLKKSIIPLELALMIVSGSILFVTAPYLTAIFSSDPAVIALGSTVLKMVAVSEPIYGIPIVLEGIMLGMGNTTTPFIFNIIGMWGVRIVGTWICIHVLHLGLVSAWACMIAHNFALFLLFGIDYLLRERKDKSENSLQNQTDITSPARQPM